MTERDHSDRSRDARGEAADGSAGGAGVLARGVIDPPPFWGRWSRIYLLVAGLLAIETVLLWWLTRWAA